MVKYSLDEVEEIDSMYDDQVPVKVIVETINNDFHDGKPVRSVSSIYYVINKIYNSDTNWYEKIQNEYYNSLK